MAYDTTAVPSLRFTRNDAELLISWTTTSPAGTWFQVYVNRRLQASTQSNRITVPYPGGTRVTVDVGAVLPTEARTNFSGSLPAISGGGDRALLAWQGGTYQDSTGNGDVQGFKIFGSTIAGGSIDYTKVLADLPAYPGGQILDGFGLGGFGQGGFGESESDYAWQSDPLTRGAWNFAVKSYDAEGNLSTGSTTSVTITTAPRPPAPNAAGLRLTRTYNATSHVVTLNWLASPG